LAAFDLRRLRRHALPHRTPVARAEEGLFHLAKILRAQAGPERLARLRILTPLFIHLFPLLAGFTGPRGFLKSGANLREIKP
jgi:hypothetical protein